MGLATLRYVEPAERLCEIAFFRELEPDQCLNFKVSTDRAAEGNYFDC